MEGSKDRRCMGHWTKSLAGIFDALADRLLGSLGIVVIIRARASQNGNVVTDTGGEPRSSSDVGGQGSRNERHSGGHDVGGISEGRITERPEKLDVAQGKASYLWSMTGVGSGVE